MPYSCQSTMTHAGSKQKIEHTREKNHFLQAVSEIILRLQTFHKCHQQVNTALHILHICRFYRAMHITQRQRETSGRHPHAGAVHLVSIRSGGASRRFALHRNLLFIRE